MTVAVYWFRNDLRLLDNPAFSKACQEVDHLLPIYIHDVKYQSDTSWGFGRLSSHRELFLAQSLAELKTNLKERASDLSIYAGQTLQVFAELKQHLKTTIIYCEHIEAPEEKHMIERLIEAGFDVRMVWQSSMLDIQSLPFDPKDMPDTFTQFRIQIEKHRLKFTNPVEIPKLIPALPSHITIKEANFGSSLNAEVGVFQGGERKAMAHVHQYFSRGLVDTYKQTRNQLMGIDFSSKLSPWLANGSCSVRWVAQQLQDYENQRGANDGTYWLWFEFLWRDYFRFLHFKYGKKLYRAKGLADQASNSFNTEALSNWCAGRTGESLVDAGMRELLATGFLSNRMRQIVASYWIYDMRGDWRAGAAWFESQLIDYDVYSNQGNWLYIAGRGTDPRGGRAFNIKKQARDYDPQGNYQNAWLTIDA